MKTQKLFKHQIFLYGDEETPTDKIVLKPIVKPWKHDTETYKQNIDLMIDYVSKHIGDEHRLYYTVGQIINFRLGPNDKKHRELPLIQFLYNYILWYPILQINGEIEDIHIVSNPRFVNGDYLEYIDKHTIYSNRDKTTFKQMCEYLQFVKSNFNKICVDIGDKLMMSISINEFASVAEHNKEARETLTCSFDIPEGIKPNKLEKLVNQRTDELLRIIESRTDLNISTYAKNRLFNKGQFKEFGAHMTHKPTISGDTLNITSNTNMLMGINEVKAYYVDGSGGRKAEIIKLAVSDAGDFERSMNALLADTRWVDNDHVCESVHLRPKLITSFREIENLDGRVFTLDPKSDEYWIIDPYNMPKEIINTLIYLKTPVTCTHPKRSEGYLCKACYGYYMSSFNNTIHIGRLSSLSSSDELQQKLLSAKHALETKTKEIFFNDTFNIYLKLDGTYISFNEDVVFTMLMEPHQYQNTYLEFNLKTIKKNKDGEGRRHDRSIGEIIVYESEIDQRVSIKEDNELDIFLTPAANEIFLDYVENTVDDIIRIPISEFIIKEGDIINIFEIKYKNSELADPLHELQSILTNGPIISSYNSYSELLDTLIPLFDKGGIHIPEIHIELIVSTLICNDEGNRPDWNDKDINYSFRSVDKSVLGGNSVINSLLYKEQVRQLSGMYNTFNKTGTSINDIFMN